VGDGRFEKSLRLVLKPDSESDDSTRPAKLDGARSEPHTQQEVVDSEEDDGGLIE